MSVNITQKILTELTSHLELKMEHEHIEPHSVHPGFDGLACGVKIDVDGLM